MKRYDLAIIGSGPGGYVAGLYASRHKLKTCVIEKGATGGTCLNRGCIPAKSLLYSAGIVKTVKDAPLYGVEVSGFAVNFAKAVSRKNEVVQRLRTGVETLLRAGKVDLIKGEASLSTANNILISGGEEISAKSVIIASGSSVMECPGLKTDGDRVLSSDDILDLEAVPASLAIIGGGVIGCEFASLFNALGSKVTVIEMTDRLISMQSREASKKLETLFRKRGIEVFTSSKVESLDKGGPLKISVSGGRSIEVERALVSVGRAPNLDCIKDHKGKIREDNGRIVVDGHLKTGEDNVYAIGDCVPGPMLAHKASYDAMLACDNIMGLNRMADYSNIPNCIWTDPEIASVGLSEEYAKEKHPDSRVAKFPYLASGKAFLMGKSEGFVKIIGDAKSNILGVEMMGEGACELIAEAVLAKTAGVTVKDWARSVHGHPTLSEVLQEAAHVFCGTPVHGV